MDKLNIYVKKFNQYTEQLQHCKSQNLLSGGSREKKFKIQSEALQGDIDISFTKYRKKKEKTPDVSWSGIPDKTKDLLLLMYDPMADYWIHWLVYNIDPQLNKKTLKNQSSKNDYHIAFNSFGQKGYGGPFPPKGTGRHEYILVLCALKSKIELDDKKDYNYWDLQDKIQELEIARTQVQGFFGMD